jgi:uncharacterized protein (TIGR03000 family)
MRRLAILGLVSVTLLASADDASAQLRGRRRAGVYVDVGDGYYGGGYYGRRGYYGGGYYDDTTPYIYPSNAMIPSAPMNSRQSFYADPNSATVTMMVPNGDAQVWFDDTLTQQRGMMRVFSTPPLQQAASYTIKARWMENGQTVNRQRVVQVQPGQTSRVDFRSSANTSEPLTAPNR